MNSTGSPVALVTGANRGIGYHIALQLAEAGVHAIVSGRSQERVQEAASAFTARGLMATPLVLDVTSPRSLQQAADAIEHTHGRLDILVNNAAVRVERYGLNPSEQPLTDWLTTFRTNLFGVVATTQAFLPLLKKAPAARIVNISSLLGSLSTHCDVNSYAYSPTFKSLPAYSASKSALNSWTVHLAYELRNTRIKVNAVHPGYTRTGLNDGEGDSDPADSAKHCVRMALLSEDGPTGTYVHEDSTVPW